MRKSTTIFCSAVALLAIGAANAELIPMKEFLSKKTTKREIPAGFTQINPKGQAVKTVNRANTNRVVSQSQTTTILYEDFNNVPDGEFVQTGKIGMRAVTPIANYDCGKFMNTDYTPNSGQWYGEWVYAGEGGTIIIQPYNPMAPAILQLPLGDYSGDLIVTARVRARPAFWGSDEAECGFVTSAGRGTNISYFATIGGYDSFTASNSELGNVGTFCKLYPNDGWAEVRTTFRNESANADGSIMFYLTDACEIDWIKVEDAGTYLAAPVAQGVTDFQENQFTVKWDPVRRAYNYYIDFFKANWQTNSNLDVAYDFENGIPSDFTAGGASIAPEEGKNESKGIRIAEGEDNALVTPTYPMTLQEAGMKFIFVQDMSDEELEEMAEAPTLCIDGLTEEGWRPFTTAEIDGFWTRGNSYYSGDFKGEEFAGQFKALRIYAQNTDDDNYFVIDDMSAYAPRPYTLDRVIDPDPEHEHYQTCYEDYLPSIEAGDMTEEEVWEKLNSEFNRWWNTDPRDNCAYVFKDCVEPEQEYFYRIRSHRMEVNGNGNTFVPGETLHALGVAAPALENAQDVKDDSYTATWKDAAKAQNFIVTNYVANEITEDTPSYTIFNETFANLEGSTDLNAYEPVTEDDLNTDMPGWSGEDLLKGQNALGCDMYGMIITPELGVIAKGNNPYYVYFEAEGMSGETLVVQFNGLQTYALVPFEADGTIAGTITINQPVEGESISFHTYNGYPFAIKALEVTQDVNAGSVVRQFNAQQIVPAGVQKATFTGLDKENKYAYKVVSRFQFERQYVRSMPNGLYKIVNLKDGSTKDYSKVDAIEGDAEVVARYTVDGMVAPKNYKGFVIEKLSNGKTRKVMAR